MTELLSRVRRLGVPVVALASASRITRGGLSNALYGRRRLSPEAAARVEAALRRLEMGCALEGLKLETGERSLRSKWEEGYAASR